jgi:hypothetical protein
MATIGDTYPSLADLYKQQDDGGDIADIIEMLAQTNMVLQDAPAVECNSGMRHLTTVRTGLPTPTWRKLYKGVVPTKDTTMQVEDVTGWLEDWSEMDAKLVELAKNPGKFRLNGARAHLAGMANTAASTMFYGDTDADPEKFLGLHARFNDTTAANGNQIVLGDGTGSDNTSIWFVTWGENSCHLLYPEGTMAGLQREDKGKTTKELSDGSLYDVFREKFTWDLGMSVRDWRGIARVANIDVSNLVADAATGTDLIDAMIDAYYQLDNPNQPMGKTVIYAGKTISKFLHKHAMNSNANVQFALEKFAGMPVTTFLGHPIRRVDAILETEATIS